MSSRLVRCLAVALLWCGCGHADPNGGNAQGTVQLASNVTATSWASLELRACPADAGVAPQCVGTASAPIQRKSLSGPGDGGAYAYDMKIAPGFTTPVKDWKIVAWLAHAPDAGDAPV